jgi:hypothetical protein
MCHWHAIADYPRLSKETPTAIGAFIETIKQHIRALDNSGESLEDIALISILLAKLSTAAVHQWEFTLSDNKMPSPSYLIAFLEKRTSCGKMRLEPTPAVKTPELKPTEQRYRMRHEDTHSPRHLRHQHVPSAEEHTTSGDARTSRRSPLVNFLLHQLSKDRTFSTYNIGLQKIKLIYNKIFAGMLIF